MMLVKGELRKFTAIAYICLLLVGKGIVHAIDKIFGGRYVSNEFFVISSSHIQNIIRAYRLLGQGNLGDQRFRSEILLVTKLK